MFIGVTALGQIKMIKTPNSVHLLPRPCLKKGSVVFLEEGSHQAVRGYSARAGTGFLWDVGYEWDDETPEDESRLH